jgi:ectoine hydroxylase-related dioxygenase (phytanoyl-CoA dioxygenase family)
MAQTLTFKIHNSDFADPIRHVHTDVTPEQIRHLVDEGYLVRERLLQGELLEELRSAADEIAERHGAESGASANESRRFGGLFVRNLLDHHPAFLKMLDFAPTLGLARAVLGPQVQVHAFVLRVTYPGQAKQETHWHFHQRVVPEPLPPFFARPHVIDNLIYLDDLTDANGPLCVVPRSHIPYHTELPGDDYSDKPGQVVLRVPAGSCITADAGLWHRGMLHTPEGATRRLLILGYSPTWMKPIDRFGSGLTAPLLANGDQQTKELLGAAGWF